MKNTLAITLCTLFLLNSVDSLLAQAQPTGPQDALTPLRNRTDFTPEEREQIRNFITQRVSEVIGENLPIARAAVGNLRAAYAGNDAFKQAYADAAINVINSAYKKASLTPAVQLLTALHTMDLLPAHTVFVDALSDDRVGVRAIAAIAIRGLRPKLAADEAAYQRALNALRNAARNERSRDTLRSMYAALDYTTVEPTPDLKPAAAALLDILRTRATLYEENKDVPALGADGVGLDLIQKMLPTLDAEQRQQLITVAATLTRFGIQRYTSPAHKLYEVRDDDASQQLIAKRNAVERLVLLGEQLLQTLLDPPEEPAVMDAMRRLNTTDMKLEWKKWATALQGAIGRDFTIQELPDQQPANDQPSNPGG